MAPTQYYTRTITDEARDQSLARHGGKPTVAWVREMWETHFREPAVTPKPQVNKEKKQKKRASTSPAHWAFLTSPVTYTSEPLSDEEIRVTQFNLREPAAKAKPEPKPQVKQKKPAPTSPAPRTLQKSAAENASQLPTAAEMRSMHKGNDNPAICQDGATGGKGIERNKWREENNKKKRGRPRKDDAERSAKKARQ